MSQTNNENYSIKSDEVRVWIETEDFMVGRFHANRGYEIYDKEGFPLVSNYPMKVKSIKALPTLEDFLHHASNIHGFCFKDMVTEDKAIFPAPLRIRRFNQIEKENLLHVIRQMKKMGAPEIPAKWSKSYGLWIAQNGSHRLTAAKILGFIPKIISLGSANDVESLPCNMANPGTIRFSKVYVDEMGRFIAC